MNLIQGTLEIIPPVSNDIAEIICDVVIWCRANSNLVGQYESSQIIYSSCGIHYQMMIKKKTYPNFVLELRLKSQSP
ncbi:hypothetical protein Glove_804g15 [Diversispora epigaea]|uniref:Uncharacterized protein n=1 Tax=Diversispora epigaea TaxID=1348612 RepID=A0A397G4W8_9GLOM|nr:hypothetical protein Glove_804g15 [Diversispora epigaea]